MIVVDQQLTCQSHKSDQNESMVALYSSKLLVDDEFSEFVDCP